MASKSTIEGDWELSDRAQRTSRGSSLGPLFSLSLLPGSGLSFLGLSSHSSGHHLCVLTPRSATQCRPLTELQMHCPFSCGLESSTLVVLEGNRVQMGLVISPLSLLLFLCSLSQLVASFLRGSYSRSLGGGSSSLHWLLQPPSTSEVPFVPSAPSVPLSQLRPSFGSPVHFTASSVSSQTFLLPAWNSHSCLNGSFCVKASRHSKNAF